MKILKEDRGISLVEVVASIVLITIILISFSTVFLQSKKTHVLSESVVDATYEAQQYMEEIYGKVSNGNISLFDNDIIILKEGTDDSKTFEYNPEIAIENCTSTCKRFLSPDDPEHWIQLTKNPDYQNKLVNVVVSVPKKNSSTPVIMESIFRWGN